MACNPYYHLHVDCGQWLNSACTLNSAVVYVKHQCGFYKAVRLYKLHQNVWQRVNGLCPADPQESPLEGREERKIEGGREVAWTVTQNI